MDIKTIYKNIETLAGQYMTEAKIHHDDWSDHEVEYIDNIIMELQEIVNKL